MIIINHHNHVVIALITEISHFKLFGLELNVIKMCSLLAYVYGSPQVIHINMGFSYFHCLSRKTFLYAWDGLIFSLFIKRNFLICCEMEWLIMKNYSCSYSTRGEDFEVDRMSWWMFNYYKLKIVFDFLGKKCDRITHIKMLRIYGLTYIWD